ncbi:MAG: ABC transporter permease [Clostridiales bacterium]|nr:ABC transporter permease [Clostridiales bacterium]
MSKIFALYHNEMTKLSRKLSVWILVTLMTVTAFFAPILQHRELSEETLSEPYGKTEITKARDTEKNNLGDPNRYVEHTTLRFTLQNTTAELFATRLNLDEEMLHSYVMLSCYNAMLANYDFDKYPLKDTYLSSYAYLQYTTSYSSVCRLNTEPFGKRDSQWFQAYTSATESLDLAKEALFSHDFASLEALSEKTDFFNKNIVHQLAKLDPEGKMTIEDAERIANAILLRDDYMSNLQMGVYKENNSYRPLNAEKRRQLEDSIKILNYQIENNALPTNMTSHATQARQFGQRGARFLLIIMLVIIAGSSISQEMATGSIKSLIIAPVKRWKIFTSKLLALITWTLFGSILITAFSTISTGMCYGFSSLSPYYYCSGGKVNVMPNYIFTFLFFLVDNISLFVYLLGAFTISCLTKNTGIAVGVSTGFAVTSGLSPLLIEIFGRQRWIDFLPSSHMDLVGKIFPYLNLCGYSGSDESGLFGISSNSLPLSFSLCYLAILAFILLFIAYDGFIRKDIQ